MAINEYHLDSLDEFWGMLSPIGDFVSGLRKPIFRGHGSDKWKLVPQVFRDDFVTKYAVPHQHRSHVDFVVFVEFRILHAFLFQCDNMGYSVPKDSSDFREEMDLRRFGERYSHSTKDWPDVDFLGNPPIYGATHQ